MYVDCCRMYCLFEYCMFHSSMCRQVELALDKVTEIRQEIGEKQCKYFFFVFMQCIHSIWPLSLFEARPVTQPLNFEDIQARYSVYSSTSFSSLMNIFQLRL